MASEEFHVPVKHILIVDNEVEFVRSLCRHLRREGFSLSMAYSGQEAREKIEALFNGGDRIDLVVTDALMPGMSGVELLGWIRTNRPEVSVLMISGFGYTDLARDTLRPELDDYGRKPLTPREMMRLIERINRKRGLNACAQQQR